jgi:hypothetical protein
MKKITLLLLFVLLSFFIYSQSLSDLMWERVDACHSNLEDVDEDGKIDYDEVIDDSKNGYLKIAGSWPTCGCGCTSEVGAYKGNKGKYTFLQKDTYSCSWVHKISSNRPLEEIMPENLTIRTFIKAGNINESPIKSYFYYDIDIPHYGTDTKLMIRPIPFGLNIHGQDMICFGFEEGSNYSENSALRRIQYMSKNLSDHKTLELLKDGNYNLISEKDLKLIHESIGDDASRFLSIEDISAEIRLLYDIYNHYLMLEFDSLILSWDREKSRFYIKRTGKKPPNMSFQEFLETMSFWSPLC